MIIPPPNMQFLPVFHRVRNRAEVVDEAVKEVVEEAYSHIYS